MIIKMMIIRIIDRDTRANWAVFLVRFRNQKTSLLIEFLISRLQRSFKNQVTLRLTLTLTNYGFTQDANSRFLGLSSGSNNKVNSR